MVRTLCAQRWGCGFDPWSGTSSHTPQLKIPRAVVKTEDPACCHEDPVQPHEETLTGGGLTLQCRPAAQPEGHRLRVSTKLTNHPGSPGRWPQQCTQPLSDPAAPRRGTPPGNGCFGPSDTRPAVFVVALGHNSPKLEAIQMLTALDQLRDGGAAIRWSGTWPWTGTVS